LKKLQQKNQQKLRRLPKKLLKALNSF